MPKGLARLAACAGVLAALAAVVPPAAAAGTGGRPAKASVRLYLPGVFVVHRQAVTVAGRALRLGGVVRPYVPGQWVTVRVTVGGHVIKTAHQRISSAHGGRSGHFSESLTSNATGTVQVSVTHKANRHLAALAASRSYKLLGTSAGYGSSGPLVALVQQKLAALHFYIPQTGVFDSGTGWALDAYHRLLGWGTSRALDHKTLTWLLNGWGAFKVRFPSHGKHVEGNISQQLLALIYGSRVYRIYPISSGKPSTPTIIGNFRVYSKVPGYLPDGMFDSSFFIRGYAVHGYDPAPDYPASHGCMRLPIQDAPSVYAWLQVGDRVDTYF